VNQPDVPVRRQVWQDVHPRYVLNPDWRQVEVSWRTGLGLAMLWAVGLIGAVIASRFQLAVDGPAGYDNTIDDQLDRFSAAEQLIFVAVFAPVLEEIVYRIALTGRLRLPLLALSGIGASLLIAESSFAAATLFAAGGIGALVAFANPVTRQRAVDWWAANPRWPVWGFALWFGLVHLVNFDVDWSIVAVLAAPIVVAPQIWLGLMFTIARVRYAWWAGLVLHAAHNLSVWSLVSVASPQSTPGVQW